MDMLLIITVLLLLLLLLLLLFGSGGYWALRSLLLVNPWAMPVIGLLQKTGDFQMKKCDTELAGGSSDRRNLDWQRLGHAG